MNIAKSPVRLMVVGIGVLVLSALASVLVMTQMYAQADQRISYIDTHGHITLGVPELPGGVEAALATMDAEGIRQMVIMPTPLGGEAEEDLIGIVADHPDRFAFLSAGQSLVEKILDAPDPVTPGALASFESRAIEILRQGAMGFGEMVGEHFSLRPGHPYISVQPDHPLFLRLADIAGRYGLPIDLHMEALTRDTPRTDLCDISTVCWTNPNVTNPNPGTFPENISALETLLSHNRGARVVWVHAGWDNTGHRTVELMRRLLEDHPNLYLNIKFRNRLINRPLDADGHLTPEWLNLTRSFPDRFMIGTDAKYPEDQDQETLPLHRSLLNQLPPDLAHKVGYLNAVRIFNLNQKLVCHAPGTQDEKTIWIDASALKAHLGHGDFLGPC